MMRKGNEIFIGLKRGKKMAKCLGRRLFKRKKGKPRS